MGKRTFESDIIALALLYRKQYCQTDMLLLDKCLQFDKVINDNLEVINSTSGCIGNEDPSELYIILTNENKEKYAVIKPNADIDKAWRKHVGSLPINVIIAAQQNNALETIGLQLVNNKLVEVGSKEETETCENCSLYIFDLGCVKNGIKLTRHNSLILSKNVDENDYCEQYRPKILKKER